MFGSHFRGFKCLIILFMPPFVLLCLVSLILRVFADFDFASRVMWVEWRFLRLCESKEVAKEAQRLPTRKYHGQYHGLGGFREKQQKEQVRTGLTEGTTTCPWWRPHSSGGPYFLEFARFYHDCSCPKCLHGLADFIFAIKSYFMTSFIPIFHPLFNIHNLG